MEQELTSIKKWNIMYPVYINSKKTVAEGRRISASKACENPNCMEISDCFSHLKIPHAVEVISRFLYFVLHYRFAMHPNLQDTWYSKAWVVHAYNTWIGVHSPTFRNQSAKWIKFFTESTIASYISRIQLAWRLEFIDQFRVYRYQMFIGLYL